MESQYVQVWNRSQSICTSVEEAMESEYVQVWNRSQSICTTVEQAMESQYVIIIIIIDR